MVKQFCFGLVVVPGIDQEAADSCHPLQSQTRRKNQQRPLGRNEMQFSLCGVSPHSISWMIWTGVNCSVAPCCSRQGEDRHFANRFEPWLEKVIVVARSLYSSARRQINRQPVALLETTFAPGRLGAMPKVGPGHHAPRVRLNRQAVEWCRVVAKSGLPVRQAG